MTDKNVIDGKLKHAEGVVQEKIGDLTNNPNEQAKGQEKKVAGKAQETIGHVKDAVRSATTE